MKSLFSTLFCFALLCLNSLFGQVPNASIKYFVNGREVENLLGAFDGDEVRLYLYPKEQSYLKTVRKISLNGEEDIRTQVYVDTVKHALVLDYLFSSTENILPVFENVQAWQGANTMPYHSKDSSVFFIYTPEDLAYFSQNCHSKWMINESLYNKKPTTCICLINDLDLGGLQKQEWFPIGQCPTDSMFYFHANIEGNNKKIKNLYINCENLPTRRGAFIYRALGIRIDKLHLIAAKILSADSGAAAMVFIFNNGEISSCSVEGDFYGKSLDSLYNSCIAGFTKSASMESELNNNIFFGNIFTNMQLQAGFTGAAAAGCPRKYCLNYGNLRSQGGGLKCGISTSQGRIPDYLRACINYGMIHNFSDSSDLHGFALTLHADSSTSDTCYSDVQLCPNIPLYIKRKEGTWENNSDTLPTRNLLGFSLQSRLGDYANGFIFEEGLYPRLRDMDERPGRLAAAPLILNEHDHALNVRNHFYVDTNYGVRWESSAPDIIQIRGNQGIILRPYPDSLTYVYAQLEDFTKRVYLRITEKPSQVATHIDTMLCVGTPYVFRETTYNSAVVYIDTLYAYTTTAPDSIFSLDLKYTSRFEKRDTAKCHRDSLPFRYNDSLFIDFGSYQFNYTSLQGCDSIVYFNLQEFKEQYTIHITSNEQGLVSPKGDISIREGDSLSIEIRPNPQCYLRKVILEDTLGNSTEVKTGIYTNSDLGALLMEYVHSPLIAKIKLTFDTVLPWSGTHSQPYMDIDSVYLYIYTPEELAWFSYITRFTNKIPFLNQRHHMQIKVINDLDLGGDASPPKEWEPIGAFRGFGTNTHRIIIDGQHKTIEHIYINKPNDTCVGLIGTMERDELGDNYLEIENWHILEGSICGKSNVGSFLGCGHSARIYSLSNAAHIKALEKRAGGMVGTFIKPQYKEAKGVYLLDCVNFGDISAQSQLGGLQGLFSAELSAIANINWGSFFILPGSDTVVYGGLLGDVIPATCLDPTYGCGLTDCFNMGRLPIGEDSSLSGALIGRNHMSTHGKLSIISSFSDGNLCPFVPLCGKPDSLYQFDSSGVYSTTILTDSAYMKRKMKNADVAFSFRCGFYPLDTAYIDERVWRLSSSPLILAEGENVLGVYSDFYVDTNYGVRWESSAPDIVSIEGNKGILKAHAKDTLVKIYARLEGFSKHIYLTVKPRSFYEKSIDSSLCMGDSCFFAGIYRKESGEYRDTLYRSGQNDMDSIFVLNLDFYPASDTSIDVFIFSKDLPYVFNGKSYTDFGKDTLYYTNVYGCDSIVYFSLEETKISYRIRITTNAGGQVNPIRDVLVNRGDSLRVWWQADTCFILDSLFVDNRLYPFAGNNSYLFTNIITDHSIRFVFKSDSIYLDSISRPDIHCGQEFLDFRFRVKAGHPSYYDLDFDREAIQKGFVQERKNIEHNPQEVSFRVPLKPYVNTYFAYLYAGNAQGCKSQTYTIPVEIHYPAQDVVRQKWKDVLAVRNDEYNGGYFFTAFQWIQDDKILKKDTLFRLFQPKGLRKGSVYRVLLSRKDGTTISSCPIISTFEEVSTFNVYPNPIKENGSISIQIDDCQENDCGQLVLIDIQGKIISVHSLKGGLNTYVTTLKQGLYMVEIKRETGEKRVLKLIVVK